MRILYESGWVTSGKFDVLENMPQDSVKVFLRRSKLSQPMTIVSSQTQPALFQIKAIVLQMV
jgi:hypothetical protein